MSLLVCPETSGWCKKWHSPAISFGGFPKFTSKTWRTNSKLGSSVDIHCSLSPKSLPSESCGNLPQIFCCGISDILIFYVYSSICMCSEMPKFVSVHLNSKNELIFLWGLQPWKQRKEEILSSSDWLKLWHCNLLFLSNFYSSRQDKNSVIRACQEYLKKAGAETYFRCLKTAVDTVNYQEELFRSPFKAF